MFLFLQLLVGYFHLPRTNRDSAGQIRTALATLPKFTIPDDKLLLVELYEKNGGRHQVIWVENSDIVNAEVINELKIK